MKDNKSLSPTLSKNTISSLVCDGAQRPLWLKRISSEVWCYNTYFNQKGTKICGLHFSLKHCSCVHLSR